MTLIDGNKIITAQLFDDEHEEFIEKRMSIIEYVNNYTTEGVTTADDVLDKIRAEIKALTDGVEPEHIWNVDVLAIIDKYMAESEG